jgi:DNA-3-methyladenine glycosylase I
MNKKRCDWPGRDPLYLDYHDNEWGVPVVNDQKLFEFLILEGMQAGLSWITILKKREAFRAAFANFDAEKIVKFSPETREALLENKGIIRNQRKIDAVITNAEAFLKLQQEQSLKDFLWQFVDGAPRQNHWKTMAEIPAYTEESEKMAKELKRKNFKFVGKTTCYALMQASGMVNDHLVDCYRYKLIGNSSDSL